jgi:colanic acid biosynthesis glycosyl transferase WcaI
VRILLHDYGGYGFIAQGARELASRMHEVLHLHNGTLRSGKGRLERSATDPATLAFGAVVVDGSLDRYKVVDRARLEVAYARQLVRMTMDWRPDVVLSANTPLMVLRRVRPRLAKAGVPLVNWLQDVHSVAMGDALVRRVGWPARPAAAVLRRVEANLLRSCAAVVPVTADFLPLLGRWGVSSDRVTVVPNWAEPVPARPRQNPFSAEHGLDGVVTLLYAGTLGLKHEPGQLAVLAEAFKDRPDVRVVVISEGLGRDWLERERGARGLDNLVLADFQPQERLPDVLASADVLLCMLRAEAATFSVPSKILTYLAAGKAQLAALPPANLAARTLLESGGGLVVDPGRPADWVAAARRLVDDPTSREALGRSGRAYAEAHFDVADKATALEGVLVAACRPGRQP